MQSTLDVARAAAEAGAAVVQRYYREGVAIRSKESYNLVSDADIESEQAIVRVLKAAFPDHHILGEEEHAASTDAEHLWLVDPLDGTNNFAHKIPHFAVSIAYYHQGEAVCGVITNPISGDWFQAVRGEGATWNGHAARVAEERQLRETLVGVGFYYDRGAMMRATLRAMEELFERHVHGIRRFGTAALDLCAVGLGRFGAYFEYELSPWDFAAGRLFVEEAGGVVTTCDGAPLPLAKSSLLAANKPLHPAVLEIVRKHHPASGT